MDNYASVGVCKWNQEKSHDQNFATGNMKRNVIIQLFINQVSGDVQLSVFNVKMCLVNDR